MQDAVILANCLYDMTSIHPRNIPAAFTDYHNQRHEHIVSQYETRKMNAKLMYGQVGISWGSNHLSRRNTIPKRSYHNIFVS